MSWLPTQSVNSRPVAANGGDTVVEADAAHLPLPLPVPVVEVPAVAEPEREARRLSRRAKLVLCGVGLGALGLVCLLASFGTSQARTKATVAPPKAVPPPSPVTPEQISSLAQGKATPVPVGENASGTAANVPGGFNGDPDNIFVTPTPLPGGGPPVTQATPLNNGATGPNNLSGTINGAETNRAAGPQETGSVAGNVSGVGTGNSAGGASLSNTGSGPPRPTRSAVAPTDGPPPSAPNPTQAKQSSYYFFAPPQASASPTSATASARVTPVNPANNAGNGVVAGNGAPITTAGLPVPVLTESRPPFGTVLPLQTLGALDSLRPNSLARLILTRAVRGPGYDIPRGTVFVGRVAGGAADRLYLEVLGYLDTARNRLVPLKGEVNGADGAPGLRGERKTVGRRWLRVIQYLAERGQQSFNTWLAGRNGGNATNIQLPSNGEIGLPANTTNVEYIRVAPGAFANLLVTELPPEQATTLAPLPDADEPSPPSSVSQNYLSDSAVLQLLTNGTPAQIRAARPRLAPDVRRLVEDK